MPLPGLNPQGHSLTDPKTSLAITGNPRGVRKGTGNSVRDMGVHRYMRNQPIRVLDMRAQTLRGMHAPLPQAMDHAPSPLAMHTKQVQGTRPPNILLRDI